MDMLIPALALLLTIGIPILGIVLIIKRKDLPKGQIMGPLGPRRREGALTFNEYRGGIRSNVEVEDPRGAHNQRYQRRHAAKQQKPPKPWMQ